MRKKKLSNVCAHTHTNTHTTAPNKHKFGVLQYRTREILQVLMAAFTETLLFLILLVLLYLALLL